MTRKEQFLLARILIALLIHVAACTLAGKLIPDSQQPGIKKNLETITPLIDELLKKEKS